MYRLIKLVVVLAIGFGIGMWYERFLMRSECAAGAGEWTGTICVDSELLQ
ncbi:hypothetical protein [Sulfitobacter sp. SK011]|jgi:hypothetical protein|nr:hypothetical protein [Sulfitobacter sp. SK011]